jgi:Mg2+ and Co2+ transporter CorA
MASLVDDEAGAAALGAVGKRFDDAIAAVEDSREALIGSFDVFMTRTAQRTNDIMKILAMTTVLLLPGSLIAGLLGMNVSIPLDKDNPLSFWIVIVGVLALAVVIVVFARVRRWL